MILLEDPVFLEMFSSWSCVPECFWCCWSWSCYSLNEILMLISWNVVISSWSCVSCEILMLFIMILWLKNWSWCCFLEMLLFHHDPVFPERSWCFYSWFCCSTNDPDAVFYRCCHNSWSCDFWVILLLFIMILSLIDILMQSWWLFHGKFSWSCSSSWSCVL